MELMRVFMQQLNSNIFIATLIFIAFDIASGYAQAIANHEVNSATMRTGFWHKLALILALVLAALLDATTSVGVRFDAGFDVNGLIFDGVCGYIIWMEVTSIMENIKRMNPALETSRLMKLFGKPSDGEVSGNGEDKAEGGK